jgi:hypothetical protein
MPIMAVFCACNQAFHLGETSTGLGQNLHQRSVSDDQKDATAPEGK